MSEQQHHWKVVGSVNGWNVEHTGPANMRFQPDQFGKISAMSFRHGHGAPPLSFTELRERLCGVRSRLNGKRFGARYSETRRMVCCEYAAELNNQVES